jgi:hypothetical protein
VVAHTCNPSTQEAETGRLKVWDQPGLHKQTLTQSNKTCEVLWTQMGFLFHSVFFFRLQKSPLVVSVSRLSRFGRLGILHSPDRDQENRYYGLVKSVTCDDLYVSDASSSLKGLFSNCLCRWDEYINTHTHTYTHTHTHTRTAQVYISCIYTLSYMNIITTNKFLKSEHPYWAMVFTYLCSPCLSWSISIHTLCRVFTAEIALPLS